MSLRLPHLSKGDILIVDDCPENLSLLALALKKHGYTTQLSTSGASALRIIKVSPPDLILLDARMPRMDGYEFCQHLKADFQLKSIPVIFVSALQEAEHKVKAFEVGATDFVSKPFKLVELLARIEYQLQIVRLQQQLNQQAEQLTQQNRQLQREIHERTCLEEALKASENELRGLFTAIQDVVLVLDDRGRYLKIAPTHSAHLHLYQASETGEGESLYNTFPQAKADALIQQIRIALATQTTLDYEYNLVTGDRTIWFSAKISPISSNSVIWVAHDITERKLFELQILEKSQSLSIFSRSLKKLHQLQMQHFQSFESLFDSFIRSGCEILGFSAGAVGKVSHQTYTFLAVQCEFEDVVANVSVDLADTFCSKVVECQGTVSFQHISKVPEMRCHPLHQSLALESYLGTPIWVEEKLFGTLCFFSEQSRQPKFEQHEIEIVEMMAQSIGKYISAHQNEKKRQQAEEEVQLLLNLTQAIATAPDFHQALDIALQSLCEATGWSYGQVWVPSANGQMLECSPIWHYSGDGQDGEAIAAVEQFYRGWTGHTCHFGEGIAGRIWSQQAAQWVPDIQAYLSTQGNLDSPLITHLEMAQQNGYHAYFGVPVVAPCGDRYFEAAVPTLLAVLVFFMETSQPQDQRFTKLIPGMTAQLGTVLRKKQVGAELQALLMAMTDVIMVLDAQGRCLKMGANSSLPGTASPLVGQTLHANLPLPIAELILGGIEHSLKTRQIVDVEYSLPLANQEVCHLARISPLSGETVILVARDITQRKQVEAALQDSEERFRTIFEQAAVGILLIDTNGQLIRVNQRFCGILGYPEFELLNLTLHDVIHPNDLDVYTSYFQQARTVRDSQNSLEIRCVCKQGETRWINLSLSQIKCSGESCEEGQGDRSVCLVAVAEDIQTRRQIEWDLQQAKESAIHEAARSAEANRTKSEFLANISHELRTPLNAILGFTQLLTRESTFTQQAQDYLSVISRSGEHLLSLINDVLEMSKIEAGRTSLKLSSFDLHYFLSELEGMLRLNAEAKGLQFIFDYASDLPQYIETDEGKLRQVLINLLGNAIKFTSEGGVTLRVRPQNNSPEGCTLLFEVEDTGIGIAAPDLETLFDPFVQSKRTTLQPEGTGLGLPISQKFVELMGGTIRITSTPSQGTLCQFSIQVFTHFPVTPPQKIFPRQVIRLLPDQEHRILVADDHTPSRQLLVKLLQGVGFDVREATHGEEAIAQWQTWKPDLIWMDMRMPHLDGYQATHQIRQIEAERNTAPSTKIIAVTASAFEEDRARVLAAGCDDFVRKPFRESVIFEKMAVHLGVRYLYDQRYVEPPPPAGGLPLPPMDNTTLQFMPSTWIQQVHQAAIRGSDEELLKLLEQIPENHTAIAQILRTWVLDYQFDQLLTLTQRALP